MNKKYFMHDQVKGKEKTEFPGKDFLMMSAGLFFSTIIVLSVAALYVR
jgi:hypothetical protein